MKKIQSLLMTLLSVILFTTCVYDHIPVHTKGTLIDHKTKLPIEGAVIKDSISGNRVLTDNNGYFEIKGIMPKQIIQISNKGYKPFCLEITLEYDKEHRKFKTFKLFDEIDWIENESYNDKQNSEKVNSNTFTVVDGGDLIVELEKK